MMARLAAGASALAARPLPAFAASAPIASGDYWAEVAAQYDVTREVIQLENGNWGMMARPVLETYRELVARVNRETSFYARRTMVRDLGAVRERLAAYLGVGTDEIVLTRNATEALTALIGQYNRLGAGDALLCADLDYDSMMASMASAASRRGARLLKITLPEPASYDNILAAYAAAFAANPALKLVLLTHISHRTGLMLPVREIVAMARARGIDTIVDAAHSLGQADFRLADLDADFVGINLHKWIGAPLGVGAAYIRRERLSAIDPDPAEDAGAEGIWARVHTGTLDYATQLSVPAALDFSERIGSSRRAARLLELRARWVEPVRELAGVEVLTPDDPRCHAGITSFRLAGKASVDDNRALSGCLLDEFGIFTVLRTGLASGACVRVTPALFNSFDDLDALATAVAQIAGEWGD
ncbi:aminotransferase class V-fold PLP-dependent enzyme [Aurantiacibacter flavus]